MEQKTTAPARPGRRIYGRIPVLLAAICVVGCLHATPPTYAGDTGIRGTVLWGPTKPGPESFGQGDEAPLSASFSVYGPGDQVAQFASDKRGAFEVSLPPGDYTIVPDKNTPIPYAQQQKTQVTVPEHGYAEVTIRLDTGMK